MADTGWIKQALGLDLIFDGAVTTRNSQPPGASVAASSDPSFEQALPFSLKGPPRSITRSAFLSLAQTIFHHYMNPISNSTSAASNTSADSRGYDGRSTVLSSMNILHDLSPHQPLNYFVMDVLEGQMITLVLVAAFILVLLIREWVVQQQPILNMIADNGGQNHVLRRVQRMDPVAAVPREADNLRSTEQEERFRESLPWPTDDQILEAREPSLSSRRPSLDETDTSITDPARATHNSGESDAIPPSSSTHASQLQRREERPEGQSPEDISVSVEDLRQICLMYEQVTRHAIAQKDRHRLKEKVANIEHINALVKTLPAQGHLNSYARRLVVMEDWTRSWLDFLQTQATSEVKTGLDAECTGVRASIPSHIGPQSREQNDAVAPPRPTMPERSGASKATEIQRILRESKCEASIVDQSEISTDDLRPDAEVESEGSDGSWQKVIPKTSVEKNDGEHLEADQNANVHGASNFQVSQPLAKNPETILARDDNAQTEGMAPPTLGQGSSGFEEHKEGKRKLKTKGKSKMMAVAGQSGQYGSPKEDLSEEQPAASDEWQSTDRSGISDVQHQEPSTNALSPTPDPADHQHSDGTQGGELERTPELEASAGRRLVNRVADWVWGDITPIEQEQNHFVNDEHVVQDIEQEEPFVPVPGVRPDHNDQEAPAEQQPQQDPEVAAAAAQAGLIPNDPDGFEDAEDLEGVMELIGMQGPLTGLLTNAMFASVVISGTIACATWLPFLLGKTTLVIIAHPIDIFKLPAQCISIWTNLVIDAVILWVAKATKWFILSPLTMSEWVLIGTKSFILLDQAVDRIAQTSWSRIVGTCLQLLEGTSFGRADLILDSLASLRVIQYHFSQFLLVAGTFMSQAENFLSSFTWNSHQIRELFRSTSAQVFHVSASWLLLLYTSAGSLLASVWSEGLKLSFDNLSTSVASETESLSWSATDRTITILIGYIVLASIGITYYMYGAPLAESRQAKKIESAILEIMHQAGGILKVVLIISIEMLVFPLYCGLLLDLAMLPLFAQATLRSRLEFTLLSPWVSCFIHWFIGTCYMFHFALFVSMCRKILRSGVLYFIRDPDDPTFHPVRDVLERNVTSQLRKIGSSALIYGGLVIICLGSVVWMLAYGISGVLPVRWTNSTGMLGFPVDLLLYTSLKPVAMRYFAPANGLQLVYEWWFRKCARFLCLSDFLFHAYYEDERTGRKLYVENGRLRWSEKCEVGTYVLVPASDQVRIPRGRTAFSEIQEFEGEPDGLSENNEGRTYPDFARVLIPNFFKIRIGLFVFCLWVLTAGAGFSLTILPLLLGRVFFGLILPTDLWASDIYSFSMGMGAIGLAFYFGPRLRSFADRLKTSMPIGTHRVAQASTVMKEYALDFILRLSRSAYTYTAFAVVIPSLFGILIELYFVTPLHGYLLGGRKVHVALLLQDWALGVQYVRLCVRLLRFYRNARPARALNAVFEKGYFNPNARLATRCFFLPAAVIFTITLLIPAGVGWLACVLVVPQSQPTARAQVRRLAYPATFGVCVAVWMVHALVQATKRWRTRIRDEVYLIGERLHNYGEKSPPSFSSDHSRRRITGN